MRVTRKKFIKMMMFMGYPKNYANAVADTLTGFVKRKEIDKGVRLTWQHQIKCFARPDVYEYAQEHAKDLDTYHGKTPWKNTQREVFFHEWMVHLRYGNTD